MDKYFIIWNDGYYNIEISKCNSQGECEKELDKHIQKGNEVRTVIVGKELTWKIHVSTELKEKQNDSNNQ